MTQLFLDDAKPIALAQRWLCMRSNLDVGSNSP